MLVLALCLVIIIICKYQQAKLRQGEVELRVCCDQRCRRLFRSLWSRRTDSLQLEKQPASPSSFHRSTSATTKLDSFVGESCIRDEESSSAVMMYRWCAGDVQVICTGDDAPVHHLFITCTCDVQVRDVQVNVDIQWVWLMFTVSADCLFHWVVFNCTTFFSRRTPDSAGCPRQKTFGAGL